jgi:hypothetical protein
MSDKKNIDQGIEFIDEKELKSKLESKPDFDFEILYLEWPRKVGKDRGMKKLKSKIKTQRQYDDFVLAVRNYAAYVKREIKSKEYIQHWSTFVGTGDTGPWRDWVNPEDSAPVDDLAELRKKYGGEVSA